MSSPVSSAPIDVDPADNPPVEAPVEAPNDDPEGYYDPEDGPEDPEDGPDDPEDGPDDPEDGPDDPEDGPDDITPGGVDPADGGFGATEAPVMTYDPFANEPTPTLPKGTPEPYVPLNDKPTTNSMHDKNIPNSSPHKMTMSDVNDELGTLEQEAVNSLPPLAIASIIVLVIIVVGILCFRCGRLGCIRRRRPGHGSKGPMHEQTVSIMMTDDDKDII
eukprot:CAMPEP_0194199268 /NCGR_PEP_ID=MMETSP0156-20130528/351_1 /TAXON_ID=33649 /ORGANISM="Thalassionema nitzschioides, Strain L26-B" /LENGTH=217 /DNA_ID=CAMNT_0038924141 /DNA_START=67 /DNA_END=720 /DNA_ORIENTATION=-